MKSIIEAIVLGMYVPIVAFAAIACWLLMARLIVPALREHRLDIDRYAIAISAVFALAAHVLENAYYGSARWFDAFEALNQALLVVGLWKLLVMASAIMAVAALSRAATDGAHVKRLIGIACGLWAVSSLAALFVV